jgi:hypothetical protein
MIPNLQRIHALLNSHVCLHHRLQIKGTALAHFWENVVYNPLTHERCKVRVLIVTQAVLLVQVFQTLSRYRGSQHHRDSFGR